MLLRLPLELKELFGEWLEAHFPDRAARVLGRMRDCRDGQLYVADWGTRMQGTGEYSKLLAQRFALACRRFGLNRGSAAARPLDCSQFRVPAARRRPDELVVRCSGRCPRYPHLKQHRLVKPTFL